MICHNSYMYNFLMKKPIFAIGVLFFIIFLFQFKNSDYMKKRQKIYKASSCTAILVKLNKIKPKDWELDCEGHFADQSDTLIASIPFTAKDQNIDPRVIAYREMAYHLNFIAKNSPNDNLERLSWVKISLINSQGTAEGRTPGHLLAKMQSVQTNAALMEHLKTSVSVKDNFPMKNNEKSE